MRREQRHRAAAGGAGELRDDVRDGLAVASRVGLRDVGGQREERGLLVVEGGAQAELGGVLDAEALADVGEGAAHRHRRARQDDGAFAREQVVMQPRADL